MCKYKEYLYLIYSIFVMRRVSFYLFPFLQHKYRNIILHVKNLHISRVSHRNKKGDKVLMLVYLQDIDFKTSIFSFMSLYDTNETSLL